MLGSSFATLSASFSLLPVVAAVSSSVFINDCGDKHRSLVAVARHSTASVSPVVRTNARTYTGQYMSPVTRTFFHLRIQIET
eukprot:COSAG05_NODE_74_length_21769_cov_194.316290_23_plen_82_part_00